MNIKKLNEEMDKILNEDYVANLEKAERFGNEVILPELKNLFKGQGLHSPGLDTIKLTMIDSFMSITGFDLQPLSSREIIDADKKQYLDQALLDNQSKMEIKLNELAKRLEKELGFEVEYVFADQYEAGIELGGKKLYEEINPIDTLTLDIPLIMRLLEYAKEDAKTDMDLHFVIENALKIQQEKEVLTMEDYNSIVNILQK